MLKTLRGLPSAVWLLGVVSLLNDAASDLVYPLLPLYLASALMAGPRALGVIEGVAETVSSLVKLFAGVLTDRTRRTKPWVVGGYGVATVSRPLIALAGSWPVMLCLRVADRVGKGLRTSPRDALLAHAVAPEQRGLAFGVHRAMDNAGAVIGPLVAAAALAAGVPLRRLFLWTAIPGGVAVALALAIREPEDAAGTADAGAVREVKRKAPLSWRLGAFPMVYRRYLSVLALFTLGNSSNTFLLLRARSLGVPAYQVPLLWGLVSFVAMAFSAPLAGLSDRVGRTRLIVGGWMVYGAFYLALGVIGAPALLWPMFAGYGVFLAATEGAERALVADLAPRTQVGSAYGWFNLTTGVMLLPASLVFGWLWQTFTPRVAFGFAAGCAVAAAVLLRFWVGIETMEKHEIPVAESVGGA